ncbi:nascent polypeptide-associated complex subunit alpha, muscle-specific form-like [Pezoporus flaviventris]|uniref:nascent polypeptide-associated complex subunit alpha, muscle-specific form-like n=1 Tax=Pezoporus flaviventris TaxID=889875 RepID=UPI002AB0B522|nr:nascent polypeptide-associated complex subunit alpha, muscle-specific form-like [Pezoporus flaviventris]
MMPRGKRDPVLLSHAELPGTDGEGGRSSGDGRRSVSEEEEGHLPGLPRDDLAKSMSGSSVSSYHSALCSDGTETFKDCLEFLDEEGGTPPRAAPSVPPPPGPLARPRQAQLSIAAKNSPGPGQGGRMGPLGGDRQAATTATTTGSGELALPRGMLGEGPSDSDEVDGEVRALTARAFRSISGPPGSRLDMCSSHTSSSLSNSLSEDGGRPRRWPMAGGEPRGTAAPLHGRVCWPFPAGMDGELLGLLGKEQFECVDVELESGEARKGHGKKRTVPKRQILLKRKERKETGFVPRGDAPAPQPVPPARKEPPSKGRAIGEDFRLNYKQFMKTASLDADTSKTRAASCLVKNVLAKKMQYEQRIKMEQKGLRGSSTSSGPSSAGTDLLGDGLEGKSSSLSRSDCSFSAEDLRGGGMPVAPVAMGNAATTHPTKGVVLSKATRENVCKLKKTFNELNERLKYQEVMEGHWLPGTTEEPPPERIRYRQARALFEAQPGVGKVLDVAPRFGRAPKPWPSLRQRAICPGHPQTLPAEPDTFPAVPPRRTFTSRAQDVRLVPQNRHEEKPPAAPRQPSSPPARRSPPPVPPKPEEKGKGRIPQPRDVRKLLKSSYNLCFGTAGASRGTTAPPSSAEPAPAAPLVIHCSSVCRREPAPQPGHEEVPAEPAPLRARSSRSSPPRRSPVHITRVQATRRGSAAAEGPPASPPRRERSEIRVPPRAATAEGVPHMETHLHVLLGPRSGEGFPAQSSAVLRTEKTVLLPPPPPSPTEGHGHGGPGGLPGSGDPHPGSVAGSTAPPQPGKPAARSAPEPPAREQGQPRAPARLVSVGSGGSEGGSGPVAPFRGGEGGEAAPTRLPERREPWERPPTWPAATEPAPPAAPAENSNYLAIPEKAPKPAPVPTLPSVPSAASGSFGTPALPSPATAPFGTPAAPNPITAPFGTPAVPNPITAPFGTPAVPNPITAPFGTPAAPNPITAPFGTPAVPNPITAPFGTPAVPNPITAPFGTPAVPNPSSAPLVTPAAPNPITAPFGTPAVPNPITAPFGTPAVPNPSSAPLVTPAVPSPITAPFGTPAAPNPITAPFGTPAAPNPITAPFGTPAASNPITAPFGTPAAPNPITAPFGTPAAPNPITAPFGTPAVPNPSSAPLVTPAVPNPASAPFGAPLVPNLASPPFGTPFVPKPASTSFGTATVPSMTNSPFGYPSASSLASVSYGTSLVSNPTNKSFGTPLIPYPASASLGTPLIPSLCSASFGTSLVPNPSSVSFGTPLVPNSASASFGTSLVPNSANAFFGTPLVPSRSSTSFGTPLVPNSASASFESPLVSNQSSTSFGSPLGTNPVPTSFGHPPVSSMASSFFGSPLVPSPASAPLGAGVSPLPGGEVPWSKPSAEPHLPRPPEGLVAAEHPVPSAQPQPRLEDAPHFLRRTDGASPSSKNTPSSTKPFAPHLPTQRRMLVDPDSGKCYYMEPPRQPQLKTLYDPETGQYLEVLVPPVASHTGLYQAPYNPLVMPPGVYGPPYVPYSGFQGLPVPPAPSAPSPVHPEPPAADNPSFSGTFSSAPKGEGPPAAGGPDCGYLESLYYIPTGMRASPGPGQPPARTSPARPEQGQLLRM